MSPLSLGSQYTLPQVSTPSSVSPKIETSNFIIRYANSIFNFFSGTTSSTSLKNRKTVSRSNSADLLSPYVDEYIQQTYKSMDFHEPSEESLLARYELSGKIRTFHAEFINANLHLENITTYKTHFSQVVSILKNNPEFFLIFFKIFCSEENFESIRIGFTDKGKSFKIVESFIPPSIIEYLHFRKFKKQLEKFKEEHCLLLANVALSAKNRSNNKSDKKNKEFDYNLSLLEKMEKDIATQLAKTQQKSLIKILELFLCRILPLVACSVSIKNSFPFSAKMEKETIFKIFKLIFKFIKHPLKLAKFKKVYKNKKIWFETERKTVTLLKFTKNFQAYLNIKTTQSSEKKYLVLKLDDLVKHYEETTKKCAYEQHKQMRKALKKEKKEFERNTEFLKRKLTNSDAENKINFFLETEKVLRSSSSSIIENFVDFQDFLKKLGFHSVLLKKFKTVEEFINQLAEDNFVTQLCEDSVHHYMTIGKIIHSSIPHMLQKKNKVESSLLIFNSVTIAVDTIFSAIQFVLLIPQTALLITHRGIKKIFNSINNIVDEKISVIGINFLFFINPNIDISIFGTLIGLSSTLFGYLHKKNEYGLKAHWIFFQVRWTQIAHTFYTLISLFIDFLHSLAKKTLDKVLFTPFTTRSFYVNFRDKTTLRLTARLEHFVDLLKDFEEQLLTLKKLDFNTNLNPNFRPNLSPLQLLANYLRENHFPKNLLKEITLQIKHNQELSPSLNKSIDHFLATNNLYTRQQILNTEVTLKYNYEPLEVLIAALTDAKKQLFPQQTTNFLSQKLQIKYEDFNELRLNMEKLFTASGYAFFKRLI